MTISTYNSLLVVILLANLPLNILSEPTSRGPFRRSYVFLTATNKRTGESTKMCANFQQYQLDTIKSTVIATEEVLAKPFIFKYWQGLENNTHLCPLPDERPGEPVEEFFNDILPMEYRIDNDGTPCTRRFHTDAQGFRNASQVTVATIQEHNAAAALLILDKGRKFISAWRDFLHAEFYDPYINSKTSIPTFYIYRTNLEQIMSVSTPDDISDENIELRFHRPADGPFDFSLVVIWLIAMVCVSGGGVWAHHRHRAGKDVSLVSSPPSRVDDDNVSLENVNPEAEKNFWKRYVDKCGNLITIFCMMVCLCGVLLLGYFFRPVLVYVFNIMLVIFGTCSIFGCVSAFLSNFPFSRHRWYLAKIQWMPKLFGRTEKYTYTSAILTLLSFAFCLTWFIERREPHAYILLDTINMALCLHVLKCLRLPSLKWITILMACMFLYDAFMVFGTPAFTKNSCSIMLEVATGVENCAKSKKDGQIGGYPVPPVEQKSNPEKFPMLMQVPHFNVMNECLDMEVEVGYQFTILGLGDIVMPGYLIAHCFTMNGFSSRVRLLYGLISITGYGIGLIVTFVALSLMGIAQPALIYLVPSTLLPIMGFALCRGEFRKIWDGVPSENAILVNQNSPVRNNGDDEMEVKEESPEDVTSSAPTSSSSDPPPPVNV